MGCRDVVCPVVGKDQVGAVEPACVLKHLVNLRIRFDDGTHFDYSGDAEASQEPKSGRATPPPVPPLDTTSPNMAKEGDVPHQMKIFQEILESETNYVRDLGVLCHIFMAPIQKHEILKKEEIDKVFGNIREIRQIHEELLSKLLVRLCLDAQGLCYGLNLHSSNATIRRR